MRTAVYIGTRQWRNTGEKGADHPCRQSGGGGKNGGDCDKGHRASHDFGGLQNCNANGAYRNAVIIAASLFMVEKVAAIRRPGIGAPDSGKNIIFRAKAKFRVQKPAAKSEKNVFIKRKNGIHFI